MAQHQSLRVVFCTSLSPYSQPIIEALTQHPKIKLVGIYASSRTGKKNQGLLATIWWRWRHSGFAYLLYLWGIGQVFPWLHRIRHGNFDVSVMSGRDINDVASLDWLRAKAPDLILCAHFNQHLGHTAITTAAAGAWNIHPSVLPANRGVDPAFYSLLREDSHSGITLHEISDAFDEGVVIAQESVDIKDCQSLCEANLKLFNHGALLLGQVIDNQPQALAQVGKGNYDSWPSASAVRNFRRKYRLWSWTEFWQSVVKAPLPKQ